MISPICLKASSVSRAACSSMREMAKPTKACEELAANFIGPKFAMLGSIIDEFVPESMTIVERHLLAFSVVGQCLVYRFHRPIGRLLVGNAEYESYTTEQLAEHVANVSIAGIRAAAAACAAKGDSP